MNDPINNRTNSGTGLLTWLESWKKRVRNRSIYIGLTACAFLILLITLISAFVGYRVAYDSGVINTLRLALLVAIGASLYWFIRRPINQLEKDYAAEELEQHYPELNGELRTYLQENSRQQSNPILGLLAKNVETKLSQKTPEQLISKNFINGLKGSVAVSAVLLITLLFVSGANLKFGAQYFLSGWFLPDRLPPQSIVVTPGDSRIKRGANLTISAEALGFNANSATIYAQFEGGDWDEVPMREAGDSQYEFSFFGVHDRLNYYVESAGVRSTQHAIEVLDVPGIQSIQITYQYPEWTELPDRVQQTGTRIQGIEGTRVQIEIVSDRPLLDGQLLALDESLDLESVGNINSTDLVLSETGTYYIADRFDNELIRLTDDYFIAVMDDQAPKVSITLPGADRGASSIEEIPMRIHVEDDYRVDSLSLNISVNAGDWIEIPLPAEDSNIEADYLMMLEDLVIIESGSTVNLVPGDLISYFVAAEDHNQQVTSDIYFIDVQPFDKRYSQAGGGGGGGGGGEDEISQRQRDILVATWNLQKEREQNEDADENYLEDNAFMLSELQRTLAEQTQTTLDRLDARRLVADPQAQAFAENMEIALKYMQPAADHLLDVDLDESVPNQQSALQHLLRAEAQFRDIQISIEQQGETGGGGGGGERDLAEIYELEMDMSRNQYETRQTPSLQQPEEAIEDAFDQLEELSRRQEALAEQARRNNELSLSEKWEQEQLTREAQELRDQLEQLQQQEQSGQQASNTQQQATEALQQNLEEIIENMQQAADSQASGQPGQQGNSSDAASAASEQLRDTLDQLSEARQQQFRETVDGISQRTQELRGQQEIAEAQLEQALERAMQERRETGDYTSGLTGQEEFELAEQKRQMADEVGEISEKIDYVVQRYSEQLPISSSALREAAGILDEERVEARLAEAAEAIEYGLAPQVSVREFVVSDALERLQERADFASSTAEAEMTRDRPNTGPTAAEQIAGMREQLERNLQPNQEQAGQQAGVEGGAQAEVNRGGAGNINPIGGRSDLGSDFNFVGSLPLPVDTDLIADQASAAAGQILALSNQLLQEGLSDEDIIRAQQLARQLSSETGDSARIADSLRALIGQLEKLELGLDQIALSRNNLELKSGSGSSAEDDDDVAEYFRNLSEVPVR
jgi:hypothetical protein